MPDEKGITRVECMIDGTIETADDGSLVYFDAHLEALDEAQATINRLHKALAEGHGVEDGGTWEDRALAAEKRLEELREGIGKLDRYESEYIEPYGYESPTGRFLDRDDVLALLDPGEESSS